MNAIFYLVGLSILIVGGEAQLQCHECLKLWEDIDMVDVTPLLYNTTFEDFNLKACVDDPFGVTCDAGEVCGKYEISLTSPEIDAVGTVSGCVEPEEAAAEFTCSDESDTYTSLLSIMKLLFPVNPADPEIRCRLYFCYDNLCNTGHTAHISLLVAILISLYQLF